MPGAESDWLKQTEEELALRHCGYWFSLLGQGPTSNRTSISLDLPRQNIFSVESLRELMGRAARREPL
jgi:hypothetical protein